ncbi:hypothetical protein TNCV_2269571 [Trichonephila clavipes]|nr:hypothetical protein TNCV_2269571 [Trichonephila clavipes]
MTLRKGLTPEEIANLLKCSVTDNCPVNPNTYVARDGIEWIPHNSNVPGRFATRNVLRQSSGPTSFAKHNINSLGTNTGDDMDVCKYLMPSRHGGTQNSRRAASLLVRLVEEEERWAT